MGGAGGREKPNPPTPHHPTPNTHHPPPTPKPQPPHPHHHPHTTPTPHPPPTSPQPPTTSHMSVAFVSNSDCGRHDTGWGHPEHVGRLRAIPKALREEAELYSRIVQVESRHATEDELAFVHDRAYIAGVREIVARGGGRLDADTVVSEGSWDAATAGAGAVLDAIDMAFGDGPPRS